MTRIARSAVTITAFTGAGMALGFLSNMVIASSFGAGREMDIYLGATTIPLFVSSILASLLSFTFIPIYTEYKTKAPEELWRVASSFINLNLLATLGLCLAGMAFAGPIMAALMPGFTAAETARSAFLLRLLLPTIVFSALNDLFASIYYANRNFFLPSLNKVISPLAVIFFVVFFHRFLDTTSIAAAMLVSAALQAFLLVYGFLKHSDFKYQFTLDLGHPGVRQILALMAPLAAGMLIYRSGPMVDRYFLSTFPAGSISHIGYAMKLISIFPAVIVPGISLALFPVMSRHAAEDKMEDLRFITAKGARMLLFICTPVVIFLGVFGIPVIQTIFERGLFTRSDTISVYRFFLIYLFSLPAMCLGTLIGQGYYIFKDTRTPAIVGVSVMTLYVVCCALLIPKIGYFAIPVSAVIYYHAATLTDCILIGNKIGGFNVRGVLSSFARQLAAAAMAAAAMAALLAAVSAFGSPSAPLKAALLGPGLVVYFFLCRDFFRTEEAHVVWNRLWTGQQDRLSSFLQRFKI